MEGCSKLLIEGKQNNFVYKHYKTLIQKLIMELWKGARNF